MNQSGQNPISTEDTIEEAVAAIKRIAWYHCVKRAAGAKNSNQLGAIFGENGSNIWYKYEKGKESPGATKLRLVEQKYPGTAKIFELGPDESMLWVAMESEDVYELYEVIRSTTSSFVRISAMEDPLPLLLREFRAQLMLDGRADPPWACLTELVAMYRALAIRSKAQDAEGATLAFGLLRSLINQPSLTHQTTQYGLGERLAQWANAIERTRLEEDDELRCEILQCAGDDPISAYLDNPIAFVSSAVAVSGKKGRRLGQCCESLSPIDYFELFLRQLPGHSEDSHPPGMDKKKLH